MATAKKFLLIRDLLRFKVQIKNIRKQIRICSSEYIKAVTKDLPQK